MRFFRVWCNSSTLLMFVSYNGMVSEKVPTEVDSRLTEATEVGPLGELTFRACILLTLGGVLPGIFGTFLDIGSLHRWGF
jgi:hypothetical protein